MDVGGNPRTLAVWEVATGIVRPLNVLLPAANDYFAVAGWLPDSKRFLARAGRTLALVDSTTGRWTPAGVPDGTKYGLASAGRIVMVERQTLDADVWLMEIRR